MGASSIRRLWGRGSLAPGAAGSEGWRVGGALGLALDRMAGASSSSSAWLPQKVSSSTSWTSDEERAHALAAVDALDRLAEERRDAEDGDQAPARFRGSGNGVGDDDLAQRAGGDAVDGSAGEDAVGGAGVDLACALAPGTRGLDQGAGGVDLVVDDDAVVARPRR